MAVPTHNPSCSTKTWSTECPDCRKPVFFFSCSCGSKVFFDALGDPWPHHYDSCLGNKVRVLRDAEGLSLDEVQRVVEIEARRRGETIPHATSALFRSLGYRETGIVTMLRLSPGTEPREFSGIIMGTNPMVNFFKRFQIADNPIGRGLLGALAKEEYLEIFIKGEINRKMGLCPQIEAFVSKRMFDRARVGRGVRVLVRLLPRTMGTNARFWVVDRLHQEE